MPKTPAEGPSHSAEQARAIGLATTPEPLHPTVRHHLGRTLRSHLSDSLSAPVGERLEALLAELDKTNG